MAQSTISANELIKGHAATLQDSVGEEFNNFYFFDPNASYKEVLELQELLVDKLKKNPLSKQVYKLVGEHPPTYTGGLSVGKERIKKLGKDFSGEVVQTDRGGQIMYHGPGQLTLYFIFNLKEHFTGPKDYVSSLFESVRQYFFNNHDLELEYKKQGLWLKDKKVGFMGIRIKNGVVYHGISLNFFTDLKPFLNESPCDISGSEVGNLFTSLLATLFIKDEAKNLVSNAPFKR